MLHSATVRLAALVWVLAGSLSAQDRGEIAGRVTDQTNAVLTGANVKAVNAATLAATSTVTNSTGEFVLPFLPPGSYSVTIERAGFRHFLREGVTVESGGSVTVDATLEVGPASERVSVVAQAQAVDSADLSSGLVVESESVRELPLRNGNPLMLTMLAPGVSNLNADADAPPYGEADASQISVNGSASGTSEFRVGGTPNTGGTTGAVAYTPPSGVVSEFKVETSPFDARSGFSTGASVNASLRPGAKLVHGQLYGYVENPAMNANSFFSNKAGLKDGYRDSRWGANASGPLAIPGVIRGRGRTFWMYGYEGDRGDVSRGTRNLAFTVPSAKERGGDFSDLVGSQYQIYDPATTRPASTAGRYTRNPFPGNVIPASRIDQTAANILARFYPMPNIPGVAPNGTNYIIPSLQGNRLQSHTFRVDHAIGDRQRIFVQGMASDRYQELQDRFNGAGGLNDQRDSRAISIDDAYVLSRSFLADLRIGYTRYTDVQSPPSLGIDLAGLGFSRNYVNQIRAIDPRNVTLPDLTISGYPELNGQTVNRVASDIYSIGVDFTRLARSHEVHFGGAYRVYRDGNGNSGRASGKINFGTAWTQGPLDNSAGAPVAQGLASFLLGLPTDGSLDVNANYAQQYQATGWYIQDTWRAAPRLTLNVGVRWERDIPTTERYNRSVRGLDLTALSPIATAAQAAYTKSPISQIKPAAFQVLGGVTFAGVNGQPRGLWNAGDSNFAPRAALAWRARGRLVIRAGYGMFYDLARQNVNQLGFSRQTSLVSSTDSGQTYLATLDNPFPAGIGLPVGTTLGMMTNAGQAISGTATGLLNPYIHRWQVSVQRGLGSNASLEASYVGSLGGNLRTQRQLDPIPAQYLSTSPVRDNAVNNTLTLSVANPFYSLLPSSTSLSGKTVAASQLLLPYPLFTSVTEATNQGFSSYHSLQTAVQRRFAKHYMLLANWTWSKYMDATSFLNPSDPAPTYSISGQDRTHRIVASGIYELPLGRGRRLGGWQMQGIYQWQSGAPLCFANDTLFYGNMKDIALARGQRSVDRWFNTSEFEQNSAAQLVYHLRTFPLRFSGIRSMGLNNWDVGLSKNTRLGERATAQLRMEAFNALNHTELNPPNTTPTSASFGKITSVSQMPRTMQASLRLQF